MKLAFAALALCLVHTVASAQGDAPARSYLAKVDLTDKDGVLLSTSVHVGAALSPETRVTNTRSYVKSAAWNPEAREKTTVTGELKTGTALRMAARDEADGSLLVDVRLDHSRLVAMDTWQDVELPNLRVAKVNDTIRLAKAADGWEYRSTISPDGTVLSIRIRRD